jgi:hypothetical protein
MWFVLLVACGSLPPWMFPFGGDEVSSEVTASHKTETPTEPDEHAEEAPLVEPAVEEVGPAAEEVEPPIEYAHEMQQPPEPPVVDAVDSRQAEMEAILTARYKAEDDAGAERLLEILGSADGPTEAMQNMFDSRASFEDSSHLNDVLDIALPPDEVTYLDSREAVEGSQTGEWGGIHGIGEGAVTSSTPPIMIKVLAVRAHSGADGRRAADQTMHRHGGQLKYCGESVAKELGVVPAGKLDTVIKVKDGKVVSASVSANSTGSDKFGNCATSKMKRWRFPSEVAGKFTIPMELSSR